eukprot:gene8147-16752_t
MIFSRICIVIIVFYSQHGALSITPRQLSDTSICDGLNYHDLTSFMYQFPLLSEDYTPYSEIFFPIFSSHDLNTVNNNIKTGIILLHGLSSNAHTYFCTGMSRLMNNRDDVLLIVPWFGNEQVTSDDWSSSPTDSHSLSSSIMIGNKGTISNSQSIPGSGSSSVYWNSSNWIGGGDSSHDKHLMTGSYDMIDEIIEYIQNNLLFPSLKRITIIGFSAGAQFLSRYTWASIHGQQPSIIRFILSDASAYLYLDNKRPSIDCIQPYNTGINIICNKFEIPPHNYCMDYNSWRFGLQDVSSRLHSHISYILSNQSIIDSRTNSLKYKDIRYIFGDADVCNCNMNGFINDQTCIQYDKSHVCLPNDSNQKYCCDTYPDIDKNELSTSCEANMQGTNRLQRVSGMGHSVAQLLESDALQQWAFSDDTPSNPKSIPSNESESESDGSGSGSGSIYRRSLLWNIGMIISILLILIGIIILILIKFGRWRIHVNHRQLQLQLFSPLGTDPLQQRHSSFIEIIHRNSSSSSNNYSPIS